MDGGAKCQGDAETSTRGRSRPPIHLSRFVNRHRAGSSNHDCDAMRQNPSIQTQNTKPFRTGQDLDVQSPSDTQVDPSDNSAATHRRVARLAVRHARSAHRFN
jgi:hypothetical protein